MTPGSPQECVRALPSGLARRVHTLTRAVYGHAPCATGPLAALLGRGPAFTTAGPADPGVSACGARHRTRVTRKLRLRAATLGFELVNRATGELVEGAVS